MLAAAAASAALELAPALVVAAPADIGEGVLYAEVIGVLPTTAEMSPRKVENCEAAAAVDFARRGERQTVSKVASGGGCVQATGRRLDRDARWKRRERTAMTHRLVFLSRPVWTMLSRALPPLSP